MEKELFTHLVKVYGILAYYNKETQIIKGINKFYDFLIDVCIWFEVILNIDIYKIIYVRELNKNEQYQ